MYRLLAIVSVLLPAVFLCAFFTPTMPAQAAIGTTVPRAAVASASRTAAGGAVNPAIASGDVYKIKQYSSGYWDCLDVTGDPFLTCAQGNGGQKWTFEWASTGWKIETYHNGGWQCLDLKYDGYHACQQGDGYQKWSLVATGSEWKIEQLKTGEGVYCLDLGAGGFVGCQQGNGYQKWTLAATS